MTKKNVRFRASGPAPYPPNAAYLSDLLSPAEGLALGLDRLIAAAPDLLESNVTASEGINTAIDHLDIWYRERLVKHLHDLQEDLHRSRSKATA